MVRSQSRGPQVLDRREKRRQPGRNTLTGLLASGRPAADAGPVDILRRTILAVACGLTLLAGGCGQLQEAPAGAAPQDREVVQGKTAALQQLGTLSVGTWASMSGYSRDRFEHWISQSDSCDTREVVLKRDGEMVLTDAACRITQGSWFSVYDGKTVSDPSELDIDHMVPLANAWRTGAKEWTDAQRKAFANDLTRPELIAVTASTNRSKGDQDPSQWKPPRRAYWCVYAQKWVAVKSNWKLSVTAAEKVALSDMLGTCA